MLFLKILIILAIADLILLVYMFYKKQCIMNPPGKKSNDKHNRRVKKDRRSSYRIMSNTRREKNGNN